MLGTVLLHGLSIVPLPNYQTAVLAKKSSEEVSTTLKQNSPTESSLIPTRIEVPPALTEDENKDSDPYDFNSDLIIKALNPGYTVTENNDKLSDVGEFIELQNLTDAPLVLAGYSLRYTNTTGKTVSLFTFPEGSYMTGKHLLLRYRKAPEALLADATYGISLAMKAGPLELYYDEDLVDTICWTGKTDCAKEFKNDSATSSRTTLVRNLASGEFEHFPAAEYNPAYDAESSNLVLPVEETNDPSETEAPEFLAPVCQGLEFSELLTYYTNDKSEQFIEFFNPTSVDINLDGCNLNYKNKLYPLSGKVKTGGYYAFYNGDLIALTKNPKNPLVLTLVDANGEAVDEVSYGNGQKKSTSFAKIYDETGAENWQITYAITPNSENIYQKFRSCEAGKIINEATGNCVKVTSLKTAAATLQEKLLEPCPAGKYRNPLTGRCKNIETASSTLKECAEGYERNPETNRCRKITQPNDGAEYALVPNTRSDNTVFIGVGIVAGIIALGGTYVILQFRREIARALRKIRQRVNHIRQNLLARGIGRHRHK